MPLTFAASLVEVSPQTLHRWIRRGKAENAPEEYRKFAVAVATAIAKAVEKRIKQIHNAAEAGRWNAAAWWLERCHPDEFGESRHEIRGLRKAIAELAGRLSRVSSPAGGARKAGDGGGKPGVPDDATDSPPLAVRVDRPPG
ncbi:MAG TPA: hypothetical protein VH092_15515 [Urbifossiella sp.]|nr:hypothetical protein [Urbifossiella sp.]